MTVGVKITEIEKGTGSVADKTKVVVIHARGYLNHGDEFWNTHSEGKPFSIDLSKRDAIPGLINGIDGMQIGGKRELLVSPHLAYGTPGIPGKIPPNAVLRFVVELLEISEPGIFHPELYPPGKHLLVHCSGEQARNVARWKFGVHEASGIAGGTIELPTTGTTWRNARKKNVEIHMSTEQMKKLIESVQSTLADNPTECLKHEDLWADASEQANNATRDSKTNSLCVTVYIYERGSLILYYGLTESSPVLLNSHFYKPILQILGSAFSDLASDVAAYNAALGKVKNPRLP